MAKFLLHQILKMYACRRQWESSETPDWSIMTPDRFIQRDAEPRKTLHTGAKGDQVIWDRWATEAVHPAKMGENSNHKSSSVCVLSSQTITKCWEKKGDVTKR